MNIGSSAPKTGSQSRGSLLHLVLVTLVFVLMGFLLTPSYVRATPANTIEGYVYKYGTTSAVSGVVVYLYAGSQIVQTQTTSTLGFFRFQNVFIHPYDRYAITVNGADSSLGNSLNNYNWGQWEGQVYTDSSGYASKTIYIDPNPEVKMPAASLFSNTPYATLRYSTTSTNTFSHRLALSVANSGVSTIGTTSRSVTQEFQAMAGAGGYMGQPSTASSVWCDSIPDDLILAYCYFTGLRSSGIVRDVPNTGLGTYAQTEYVDPSSLYQNYEDRVVSPGLPLSVTYQEAFTTTWSYRLSVPFGINYMQHGIRVDLDVTATTDSSTTTSIGYTINNTGSGPLNFRIYPVYTDSNGNKKVAAELHVWQYTPSGGGGGCSPAPADSNMPIC